MKTRVLFMGTPDFACGILQVLAELPFVELVGVVSQPDKKVGRQQKLQPTPVHALAQQLALPVLQPEKIRTEYAEGIGHWSYVGISAHCLYSCYGNFCQSCP